MLLHAWLTGEVPCVCGHRWAVLVANTIAVRICALHVKNGCVLQHLAGCCLHGSGLRLRLKHNKGTFKLDNAPSTS